MNKVSRKLAASVFLAICSLFMFCPQAQARHPDEVVGGTHLVNLEARPKWFQPGKRIDFLITLRFDDGHQDGFDIGVFHEGRLVGWETNRRLNEGMNTFKIHDRHFKGEPGDYIVQVRFRGQIIKEKRFVTANSRLSVAIISPRLSYSRLSFRGFRFASA